ncbi:MAG TPA: hypothetical protein VNX67_10555 [Solirubrobacteraceae bacterium]|nr:hypothetical protein [Solirubrobacteraceae bacterium]
MPLPPQTPSVSLHQSHPPLPGDRQVRGSFAQNIVEPHELDEPTELRGNALQAHLTTLAPGGELESRERVDGYDIDADPTHVTDGHACTTAIQEGTQTHAQPR